MDINHLIIIYLNIVVIKHNNQRHCHADGNLI